MKLIKVEYLEESSEGIFFDVMFEKEERIENYRYSKRTARKISEQQKIDNLNKIFNENYK